MQLEAYSAWFMVVPHSSILLEHTMEFIEDLDLLRLVLGLRKIILELVVTHVMRICEAQHGDPQATFVVRRTGHDTIDAAVRQQTKAFQHGDHVVVIERNWAEHCL